jgi:hypothetical protein
LVEHKVVPLASPLPLAPTLNLNSNSELEN